MARLWWAVSIRSAALPATAWQECHRATTDRSRKSRRRRLLPNTSRDRRPHHPAGARGHVPFAAMVDRSEDRTRNLRRTGREALDAVRASSRPGLCGPHGIGGRPPQPAQNACGLRTRAVWAGKRARRSGGRIGRRTSSPPQFGQRPPGRRRLAHSRQNVHSNEHISASGESGGRSRSQHSQFGLSCSIVDRPRAVPRGRVEPRLSGSWHRASHERTDPVGGVACRCRPAMAAEAP